MRTFSWSATLLLIQSPSSCLAKTTTNGSSYLRSNSNHQEMTKTQEDASYWERLMQGTAMSSNLQPFGGGAGVGDSCFVDGDCATSTCVFDPPVIGEPGICACNPGTQEGCEGDFFCAAPGDIGLAVGELISVAPFCKLRVGSPCEDASDCLTNVCDGGICRCNTFTNFPCADGEVCALGESSDSSLLCKVPDGSGEKPLGSDCFDDLECETGTCYFGFIPPGTPGTCLCNPNTNAGCSGDFICYSSDDLLEIQFVADASNKCLLPYGAACDGRADIGGSCVTGNCAGDQCTCNELSNWPCNTDIGEACVIDAEGSFACVASPEPLTICPEPGDTICTLEYLPVLCTGDCEYSNQCVATSADPTFTAETCELVNPPESICPVPGNEIICTKEYVPVLCPGDCEYSNQCIATSANPAFTADTCELVEPECPLSTGICTQEFAPVNCSGCQYSNQCIATDANPEFNSTTCTPVTNP